MSTTSLSVTSITDLLALYRTDARVAQIAEGLQTPAARVQISGTIGSAQALIAHSVIEQRGLMIEERQHYLWSGLVGPHA